jgi:RHH-type proline utilization regulon transcriptional repressor/proline dehydrogenase/delta 1-pyrroline-5-carboxylate dehydrogenase
LHISTLPGPTGELNILSSYPKGIVLCLGPTSTQAKQQAKLAHDAGCNTCIILNIDLSELTNLKGFDVVIFWAERDAIQKARTCLANRNGPLIPLITDINVTQRCILERHVCIDTTAAGGNVALLASGG